MEQLLPLLSKTLTSWSLDQLRQNAAEITAFECINSETETKL
jgi:hypothetical protein